MCWGLEEDAGRLEEGKRVGHGVHGGEIKPLCEGAGDGCAGCGSVGQLTVHHGALACTASSLRTTTVDGWRTLRQAV